MSKFTCVVFVLLVSTSVASVFGPVCKEGSIIRYRQVLYSQLNDAAMMHVKLFCVSFELIFFICKSSHAALLPGKLFYVRSEFTFFSMGETSLRWLVP